MGTPENARKPQILPISLSQKVPKLEKSTDHGHKLISSEGFGGTDGQPENIMPPAPKKWGGGREEKIGRG